MRAVVTWIVAATVVALSASCGSGSGPGSATGGTAGSTGGSSGASGAAGGGGLGHEPEWLLYASQSVNLQALDVGAAESEWSAIPLGVSGDPIWSPDRKKLFVRSARATIVDFGAGAPGDKIEIGSSYHYGIWAPSSGKILLAFQSTVSVQGVDSFYVEIYDLTQPSPPLASENGKFLGTLAFAPKSDVLALLAQPNDGSTSQQLIVLDLRAGTPVRTLFHEYASAWPWAWSPTDDVLATARPELQIVPLTPSALGTPAPLGVSDSLSFRWWPDGSGVVAQTASGLSSVDVVGGTPAPAVSAVSSTGIPLTHFALSPDSAWIVHLEAPGWIYPSAATGEVLITRRTSVGFSAAESLIPSLDFDGNSIPLGSEGVPACSAGFVWSPDGKSLTYRDNLGQLYWVDTSGATLGARVLLSQAPSCRRFSRDGTRLAFSTDDGLYVTALPPAPTPTKLVELAADQSVNRLDWSASGKLAFSVLTDKGPYESDRSIALYVVSDADAPSAPKQIEAVNGGSSITFWW